MLPYRSTLPLGGANLFSFYIDLKQNNSRRSIPRENRRGDKRLAPRAKPGALGFLLQWVRNQQQGVGLQLQLQLHPQLFPQLQPQPQLQPLPQPQEQPLLQPPKLPQLQPPKLPQEQPKLLPLPLPQQQIRMMRIRMIQIKLLLLYMLHFTSLLSYTMAIPCPLFQRMAKKRSSLYGTGKKTLPGADPGPPPP